MKFYLLLIIIFLFFILLNVKKHKKEIEISSKDDNYSANITLSIKKSVFKDIYIGKILYNNKKISLNLNNKKNTMVIGNDEKYFWYYSDHESNFYYGELNQCHNILKEIFNPINLREILIPQNNNTVVGNYGKILKQKITFDKNNKIIKKEVFDNDRLIFNVNYEKYNGELPKYINVFYNIENIYVSIKLEDIEISNLDIKIPISNYKNIEKLSP